jgi:hypothetical protein
MTSEPASMDGMTRIGDIAGIVFCIAFSLWLAWGLVH